MVRTGRSSGNFHARRSACALTLALIAIEADARAQTHVTCVGDSITQGDGPKTAYPALLQNLIGPSYAVVNAGHSGATLLVHGDLPYASTNEYSAGTTWAAGGGDVVLQLGTNDSKPRNWTSANKATFLSDCTSLVRHYLSGGHTRVWVNLIPPATANACCTIDGGVIEKEVLPLLRTCAADTGASTIDVYSALVSHPEYFGDGVHPDARGTLVIAQTVQSAITRQPRVTLEATPSLLTAAPIAAWGKVERVTFYDGPKVLGDRVAPPWVWKASATPGAHAYTATMVESAGRMATSAVVPSGQ